MGSDSAADVAGVVWQRKTRRKKVETTGAKARRRRRLGKIGGDDSGEAGRVMLNPRQPCFSTTVGCVCVDDNENSSSNQPTRSGSRLADLARRSQHGDIGHY